MIKLNRTTEYGLLALRFMSERGESAACGVSSAREIAEHYGLPFEITAKTLQRLKDTGIIESAQGAKGGYTLKRPLSHVNLAEFLSLMEGPQGVVACASEFNEKSGEERACCEYENRCGIRSMMGELNTRVQAFLTGIKLNEFTKTKASPVADFSVRQPAGASHAMSAASYQELAQEP